MSKTEIKNHTFEFKIETPVNHVDYADPRIAQILAAVGAVRKFMPVISFVFKRESATVAKFILQIHIPRDHGV